MIRTLAGTILKGLGYAVTLAEDGLRAVDEFTSAELPFDLAILDLTMPNLSGLDAMKRIRAFDPRVPVILASGYSADRAAAAAGAGVIFLDKPYSAGTLGSRSATCVPRHTPSRCSAATQRATSAANSA